MPEPKACLTELPEMVRPDYLHDWLHAFAEAESKHPATTPDGHDAPATPSEEQLHLTKKYLKLLERVWPEAADSPGANALGLEPDDAEHFPALEDDISTCSFPMQFGRFKVTRILGRGGHGIVYQAIDPVLRRDVALKVPRAESLASPELRRRFLREAQAVAALSHPNLVTVYEARAWGPVCYIASRYCAGPSLSRWMAQQDKPVAVETAARLAATLADTVDYVHSQGILHRDLKPSNVLLEPLPDGAPQRQASDSLCFTPKLTDFGLAKWLSAATDTTASGDVLGTPAYMAPEQASGRVHDMGPTADIYALGAILYHLVTGQPPFQGSTKLETLRLVIEGQLIAPRRLRADVPPDLEAVCLRCLEHQSNSRYATAGELAADLRRFLGGQPVRARRAGPTARLAKWSRRKPLLASLTLCLILVVLVAFGAVTWQWRRTEQQRNRAEDNLRDAHAAIREFHKILDQGDRYDDPDFQPLRKQLLEASLRYYRRFLQQRPDDPSIQSDIADSMYQLGYVASTRGSKTEALEILSESLPIWEQLSRAYPDVAEYRYFLAKTHDHMGLLQHKGGDRMAAIESYQRALAIRRQLVEAYPDVPSYRNQLGQSLHQIAQLHSFAQDWGSKTEALEILSESLPIWEQLSRTYPDVAEYRYFLAKTHDHMGLLQHKGGDRMAAIESYQRALAIRRQLVEAYPDVPSYRNQLGQSLHQIAQLHSFAQDWEECLRYAEQAQLIFEALAQTTQDHWKNGRMLAATYQTVGSAHLQAERRDQAMECYERAREICENLVERNVGMPHSARKLAHTLLAIGSVAASGGDARKATQSYERCLGILQQFASLDPSVSAWRRDLASCHFQIAALLTQDSQRAEKQQHLEWILRPREQLVRDEPEGPEILRDRRDLGQTMLELGKLQLTDGEMDMALDSFQAAHPLMEGWLELHPNHLNYQLQVSVTYLSIGAVHSKKGNPAEAVRAYRSALAMQEQVLHAIPNNVTERTRFAEILASLASQLKLLGRYSEAEIEYRRALEQLSAIQNEQILTTEQHRLWTAATEELAAMERDSTDL